MEAYNSKSNNLSRMLFNLPLYKQMYINSCGKTKNIQKKTKGDEKF